MEEGSSAFKILTGKPTGKTPLGRSRSRWEDNIKMDLKEISGNMRKRVDSALNHFIKTNIFHFIHSVPNFEQ